MPTRPILKEPAVLKELIKDVQDLNQINLQVSGGSVPRTDHEYGRRASIENLEKEIQDT